MSDSQFIFKSKLRRCRLIIMGLLVFPTAGWAVYQTFVIFEPNTLRPLEWLQLILGALLYLWLAMAFWTAIIGFLLKLLKRDPLSFKRECLRPDQDFVLQAKHAVVMPVYNEDTRRIIAGFKANALALDANEQGNCFDFYLLSDTQDPEIANKEMLAWQELIGSLPRELAARCYYRRRQINSQRKVGNIKDFCQRWGYQYEGMIVLDADSLMSAEKMLELAQRLEANESSGLIQTIPMPILQSTFFGRFVQFAAHVYSPMLATGLSFWQSSCANYWGHNAIIRVDAFLQTCGLPTLKGAQPFGGDILSHDFVEAALMKRAGWDVYLLTDTKGSYEEVPSNIIDYATRDRRWVQGNMQHLALLGTTKLKFANRMHFFFGAFAYSSSILLLLLLLAGTADAVILALSPKVYFTETYQLFPTWLITKKTVMIVTLYVTIALLFLPKLLGIILTLFQRSKEFGGSVRFLLSAICEFIFAVLLAPVMMLYHSYFVLNVLARKSVKWEAQTREGRMIPWRVSIGFSWPLMLIGACWSTICYLYTPTLFYWLLPVNTGLLFAPLIIRLSSSIRLGKLFASLGLLQIPEEICPSYEMNLLSESELSFATKCTLNDDEIYLMPPEEWRDMPTQTLKV